MYALKRATALLLACVALNVGALQAQQDAPMMLLASPKLADPV